MNFTRLIDFKWVRQLNKVNLANFLSVVQRFLARWLVESYGRWMLRALWLVVAQDLLVHRRTVDVTGNLSVLFVLSNMARFWKCLRDYFGLRKWVRLEKSLTGAVCKYEKQTTWKCFQILKVPLPVTATFIFLLNVSMPVTASLTKHW